MPVSLAEVPVRAAARCTYQPRGCPIRCGALVMRTPSRVLLLRSDSWEPLSIADAADPSLHFAASWGSGARFDVIVEDLTEDEIAFVRTTDRKGADTRYPANYTLELLARLHAARAELATVERNLTDIRRACGLP